jgi:hypothetical protein
MRRLEAFCGVHVRDYVVMANHFHLLCEVPEPRPLSQSEVLERIQARYGPQRVQGLQELCGIALPAAGAKDRLQAQERPHRFKDPRSGGPVGLSQSESPQIRVEILGSRLTILLPARHRRFKRSRAGNAFSTIDGRSSPSFGRTASLSSTSRHVWMANPCEAEHSATSVRASKRVE